MKSIREALIERKLLVSDGAWGTMLMRAGLQPGECPELWNVEHPEVVRGIGSQYVAAGADLIMTNSFGGSSLRLARHGLGARARELNRAAAALSREAAGSGCFVVGSMGPTGAMLLLGDLTEQEVYDAFREQALALAEGGADACCIETMSALDEAAIAVRAARESTSLEVICTFTFDREVNGGFRSMMGVSPNEMAIAMLEAGADIIGTNCGQGPAEMVSIVAAIHEAAPQAAILVQPNAGIPVHTDRGDQYPETPESMARFVPSLVQAGASIIGGCCGTTPEHIREMAGAVRREARRLR